MHTNVHRSTVYSSRDMEAAQISTNRRMDKEDVVHRYNGILLNHKKEKICAISRNMDGLRDCHTMK